MIELPQPTEMDIQKLIFVAVITTAIIGGGHLLFGYHDEAAAENLQHRGIIEDVTITTEPGDDHIHIKLAESEVTSVSVYLYDREGHTDARAEHVYTGTTVTLEPDMVDGHWFRAVTVAPNGTALGSATFEYQNRRVPNE